MFGVKAVRTVIGIASTSGSMATVITGKILFDFDEMFGHEI